MTNQEKDSTIRQAIEVCLDKAEGILEANQEKGGIRSLFTVYVDGEGSMVRSTGHSLAMESGYQEALMHIISRLFHGAMEIEQVTEEK